MLNARYTGQRNIAGAPLLCTALSLARQRSEESNVDDFRVISAILVIVV